MDKYSGLRSSVTFSSHSNTYHRFQHPPSQPPENWRAVSGIELPEVPIKGEFNGELSAHLPKTIKDAIFVAKEIGIPSLWVNQYCINQVKL